MIARLLLGVALALGLAACQAEPAHDWPDPSPALWRVTAPDGQQGWLFGTVHALPDGAEWQTALSEEALGQAGLLVVEIAALGQDQAGAEAFASLSQSPGLPPLLERVGAQDRALVAGLLEASGQDESTFAEVETWAAAIMLSGSERLGDPENGVDRALLDRGLPVEGLETHASQFALFDGLSAQDQADLLVAVAREAAQGNAEQALEEWLTGDLPALERRAFSGMMADDGLREALLDGRNRRWAARIADLVAAGRRPFVGVGAAHMLGQGGLPALLAARGFRVERIQ